MNQKPRPLSEWMLEELEEQQQEALSCLLDEE